MSKINTDRIGTRDGTLDIDVKSIMVRDDSMENLGDYEQGLELTQQHQFIWKDESKYTVKLGHAPFVLTGVWEFDKEKLEIYGAWDHSALTNRDKEGAHDASAISRGAVAVDSIADLLALPDGQRKEGLRYLVKGYHAGSGDGGGEFYWDTSRSDEFDAGSVLYGFVRVTGVLTSYDFGAVGDGKTHPLSERYSTLALAQEVYPHATSLDDEIDWCGIQAMLDIARTREFKKYTLNWGGNWHLNKTVKFIATVGDGEYRSIYGDFKFTVTDDFVGEAVIEFHGRGITQTGVISGSARNLVEFGIIVDRRKVGDSIDHINFGIKLDRIFINNCLLYAVSFGGNAMFSTLEFLRTTGNGISSIYAGKKLTAVISDKVDSGVGGNISTSVLTVDVLPPTYSSKGRTFIVVGGEISLVTDVDRINSTLTVKPHISKGEVELSYILGGGVKIVGSDSASIHIKQMSVLGSGIALDHSPMYPALIGSLTTEYCGIGIHEQGLVGGANILEYYAEGNTFDYVSRATSTTAYGSTSILHGLPPNFDKYAFLTNGRLDDGTTPGLYAGAHGISVREKGLLHYKVRGKLPRNAIPNGVANDFSVNFNEPHINKVYYSNTVTIGFHPVAEAYNKLFAYDSQEFTIIGSGNNAAPTRVTFTPPAGYTLNGGDSNVVFSGFSASAEFTCFLQVVSKNIIISCSTLSTRPSSTYTQLPTDVVLKDLPLDEVYWFSPSQAGGETGIPLPSDGIAEGGTITKRYSHRPPGGLHNITQEVAYETKGEIWRRFLSSGSGVYGSWSLVSYKVQKSTSGKRPVNPALGHRYYDTTLLASGKPISWNGSAWVDALGAVV